MGDNRTLEVVVIQVLSRIIQTKDLSIVLENGLTVDYFVGYEQEFEYIMDHYERYNCVPDEVTIRDVFPEFRTIPVDEPNEYLLETLVHFYRGFSIYQACVKTVEYINNHPGQTDIVENLIRQDLDLLPILGGAKNCGVQILGSCERFDDILQKKDNPRGNFIKTGFDELDSEIGGWSRGEEFVVLFGRTGQGKSWILLKTLLAAAKCGNRIGLVSPEMSASSVGYRSDTISGGFSNFALKSGKIADDVEELSKYDSFLKEQSNSGDFFLVASLKDFNNSVTISKLRNWVVQNKLDVLAIDGIKYIDDERRKRGDNTTTMLTNISEDLMTLSVELKIPVIVCVQSNRGGSKGTEEDGLPELENIRDSDGISHSATKVIAIRQRDNKIEMQIKKNRDGNDGQLFVYNINLNYGKFEFESSTIKGKVSNKRDDYVGINESHGGRRKQMPSGNSDSVPWDDNIGTPGERALSRRRQRGSDSENERPSRKKREF